MMSRSTFGLLLVSHGAQPLLRETQGVVPEGVDLHCLTAARCYDPPVNLRVHPGKLVPFGSLPQQAVVRIYTDSKVRPLQVMVNDLQHLRQQDLQCFAVATGDHVSLKRMEIPKCCVSGVVQALTLAFWKHVRQK